LRGVGYPKRLVNSVSRHPHNPIGVVYHEWYCITLATRDFLVHEKVLELLAAAEPNRTKTVTRAAISYGQTSFEQVAAHARHGSARQGSSTHRRFAACRERLS